MQPQDQHVLIARALAAARIRALRLALLDLHKAVLDNERRRYERIHGRIETPQAALRLALEDPAFQWLHPLAETIVQMDERLADEGGVGVADANAFTDRVRGLLQGDQGSAEFRLEYHRVLQDAPEVVVAHGRVAALFSETR
jgi:hypothetical protein